MGYYRRRRRYSSASYGRARAEGHAAEAHAFSAEVAHTDQIVKETFFNLSGASLDDLLNRYGKIYGPKARAYAAATIPKWKAGKVQMSGMVAKRLFSFLPPYMPAAQKNRIVEAIWRAYGPRSKKYVYVGPDASADEVVGAIADYFANIDVLYPIPEHLRARFNWLAQDDAVAQERLLNHFMDAQRHAAIASARLNVPVLLQGMAADANGSIEQFTHTLFVGNHQVEIRADPLRSGFVLSDSSRDMIRPPVKMPRGFGIGFVATLVLAGVIWQVSASIGHGSVSSNATGANAQSAFAALSAPSAAVLATAPPAIVHHIPPPVAPAGAMAAATATTGAVQAPVGTGTATVTFPVHQAPTNTTQTAAQSANGCSAHQIASVADDGSTIVLSNGVVYSVTDDMLARAGAADWVTGQDVTVCGSGSAALHVGYDTVNARAGDTVSIDAGSCRSLYVGYADSDGEHVGTTDGSVFTLNANMLERASAAGWTTGQTVRACSMKVNGVWRASLVVGYDRVQTTVSRGGTGEAIAPRCGTDTVRDSEGSGIRLSDGSYRVENMLMQAAVRSVAVGTEVTVCKYVANAMVYSGIVAGYDRIEGVRSQ